MRDPQYPDEEVQRQAAVDALSIVDTPAEEAFDRVVRLAAALFEVPTALFTIVDRERQWFKARVGMDVCETPRRVSFCGHAILHEGPMVVPDATEDPRFADNPLVRQDPRIRFYAGQPVKAPDGRTVGTLCLIDQQPRPLLSERQLEALRDLVAMLESELLRRSLEQSATQVSRVTSTNSAEFDAVIRAGFSAKLVIDPQLKVKRFTAGAREYFALHYDDVERPIAEVESFLDYPTLLQDLANVASFGEPVERRVYSITGKRMLVQLMPFREPAETRHSIIVSMINQSDSVRAAELDQVLNGIGQRLCVIDGTGTIVMTNRAWDQAAKENGDPLMLRTGCGANYLTVCQRSRDPKSPEIAAALKEILSGRRQDYQCVYECSPPGGEPCYYLLNFSTVSRNGVAAVATHTDVTAWVAREALETEASAGA